MNVVAYILYAGRLAFELAAFCYWGESIMAKKPTIAELEKILSDPEEHPIIILPDGSITVDRRRKGTGFLNVGKVRVNSSY